MVSTLDQQYANNAQGFISDRCIILKRQKAVTAYLTIKQLLPFGFAGRTVAAELGSVYRGSLQQSVPLCNNVYVFLRYATTCSHCWKQIDRLTYCANSWTAAVWKSSCYHNNCELCCWHIQHTKPVHTKPVLIRFLPGHVIPGFLNGQNESLTRKITFTNYYGIIMPHWV